MKKIRKETSNKPFAKERRSPRNSKQQNLKPYPGSKGKKKRPGIWHHEMPSGELVFCGDEPQ